MPPKGSGARGRGGGRGSRGRGRKMPFSGKAKAAQLKEKRAMRRDEDGGEEHKPMEGPVLISRRALGICVAPREGEALPTAGGDGKLRTVFRRETDEEVQAGKADATRPLQYRLYPNMGDCDRQGRPRLRAAHSLADLSLGRHPSMPLRPDWRAAGAHTAEMIDNLELDTFEHWKANIYAQHNVSNLNYFEQNLEVWRQLWRVVERSGVVVLLADARCPFLFFHQSLYNYVTETLERPIVLCLTKADLVPEEQAASCKAYFQTRFPKMPVVHFISSGHNRAAGTSALKFLEVIAACQVVVDPLGDPRRVQAKGYVEPALQLIRERLAVSGEPLPGSDSDGQASDSGGRSDCPQPLASNHLVVGLVGCPNTGKSSLLNEILGQKKVSVSATPGHTKHMQTHFITQELVLCDCPGLVFPQVGIQRPMQIIFGSYPIAQVRDPFTVVRFVAEHCWPRLHVSLKLKNIAFKHHDDMEAIMGQQLDKGDDMVWSPYTICHAFAIREGFHVKGRGGRPDVFRAANRILRDALNGRGAYIAFYPPAESDSQGTPHPQERNSSNAAHFPPEGGTEQYCDDHESSGSEVVNQAEAKSKMVFEFEESSESSSEDDT